MVVLKLEIDDREFWRALEVQRSEANYMEILLVERGFTYIKINGKAPLKKLAALLVVPQLEGWSLKAPGPKYGVGY